MSLSIILCVLVSLVQIKYLVRSFAALSPAFGLVPLQSGLRIRSDLNNYFHTLYLFLGYVILWRRKKKNWFTQIFSFGNKILHEHHTRFSRRKNVNLDFSVILYFKKYFLGSESVKNDNSDHDQYYITVHHKEYINSQSCIQLCTSMYCMYSYMCFQQQVSGTV